MTKTASKKPTVEELIRKYPTFEAEFAKLWRKIIRKALSEQVAKNPNSRTLRGIKEVVRNHFTILLDDGELNKVVDMISQRFSNRKLSPEWDEYRSFLPNIFPEKSLGQIKWSVDDDGIPETMSMIEEKEDKVNQGCAVIIIQHNNFRNEYTNVPAEVALTINAELSKALS
jgi:hypothetical protein